MKEKVENLAKKEFTMQVATNIETWSKWNVEEEEEEEEPWREQRGQDQKDPWSEGTERESGGAC